MYDRGFLFSNATTVKKKLQLQTTVTPLLADVYTPVGIYLRLRDKFRDTILLESTDNHAAENSFSFIGINAIAGIEITNDSVGEYKLPNLPAETFDVKAADIPEMLWNFAQRFEVAGTVPEAAFAQALYGYTAYNATQLFEPTLQQQYLPQGVTIPWVRYRLYQYVIAINHYKDELYVCENHIAGIESDFDSLLSLITAKDVPSYPFATVGEEASNLTDDAFVSMVQQGIEDCYKGNVFQIVLSRRFEQKFIGDEFNVYRRLRSINPSPYLFFFDYGDYKLMGSSPESQLIIQNNIATVHPIAGTFKRTGNDAADKVAAADLLANAKENAEHVMLVDLARNDLSRHSNHVQVSAYKEVHYYSHVIHMVSEVKAQLNAHANPFKVMADSFPAGTLSGAPKVKAMEIIQALEPTQRGYYGGAIGMIGLNGSCNHAIMIRTLLSKHNTLYYQAGAGVVAASVPEHELQEVHHKLQALKKAITAASSHV